MHAADAAHRTTMARPRVYAAAGHPEPELRRDTRRTDPIVASLRAALTAASRGVPMPSPDFDALSQRLSAAADQYLRSLSGRTAAHWLFTATLDLAGRLTRRELGSAAAALESAHLALRFAHTRVADAPELWRALADIACALALTARAARPAR